MSTTPTRTLLLFLAATVFCAFFILGCDEEDETITPPPPPVVNTGSASFTRFVSIGNSLTAGFQSNALSERDQASSFPNLIAGWVKTDFEQPVMKNPGVGSRIRLAALTPPTLVAESGVSPTDPSSNLNIALARPYNNLGIPGALLFDIADTADFTAKSVQRANPFFALVLRNPALGKSILAQTKALSPTFISVWIGNNDVLGYATSGGAAGSNVGLGGTTPRTLPTEPQVFASLYASLMTELKATGAGIVTANIPDVTSVPFFTTVPSQGLVLRQGQADTLNFYTGGAYGFTAGPNGWVAATKTGNRKLTASEFVLLSIPQDSLRLAGWGSVKPIPTQYVLDSAETRIAKDAVAAFNAIIDSVATNRGIGVVNMNGVLAQIKAAGLYDPSYGTFTSSFITGGVFSYDGVHPSSRGHVIIANEFFKVINTKFSASIPPLPLDAAPGIPIGKPSVSGPEIPSYPRGTWESFIPLMNGGRF